MTPLIALASCAIAGIDMTDAEMRRIGFDPARMHAIVKRLDLASDKGEVAGSVVLVARNGKVALEHASGFADREQRIPMRSDTVFQVMSMTKPFVGVAVVQCAEAGLLNLDDPVEMYLPRFKGIKVGDKSAKSRVTIRHLLTHTSGLSGNDPGGLDDDRKRKMTLAEYAALIGDEPLISQPGEEIHYSGVGINALARVVEIVSGQKLEDYVKARIFEPCGMKNTWFFLPASERGRLAKTYEEGPKEFVHDRFREGSRLANGAGGLYSTTSDMAKFMIRFSRQGGGLVSPAGFAAMTTVQTGDLPMDGGYERGFGLTFSVVRAPGGTMALRAPGSFGHTGAFCTEFWADPKTGVVAVFLSQGFGLGDRVRKTFSAMVNAAVRG